jgi:hypothetical protein
MVTRLILLIILGFVAALYFPDSRQVIVEQANPVIQPVLVWSAEREIQRLSQGVRMEAREKYTLPTNRTWNSWLSENFSGDGTTDPWGALYSYQAWADSFAIGSDGPDGQRDTEDDIRTSQHRPYQLVG